MFLGAALTLAVSLSVLLAFANRGGDPAVSSADPELQESQLIRDEPAVQEETTDTSLAVTEPESSLPPDGAYVQATLEDNNFVLKGVVPSPDLASDLLQAATVAYSPFVRSELMVDEQLDSADWLASSPQAIVLLPTITDGTILMADGEVIVSGRAPNQGGADRLEGALGEVTGLPVAIDQVEITNLEPPLYVIAAIDGRVALSGRIPTEEIRGLLVAGAAGAYGAENVEDNLVVDPAVYPSLWMYQGGPLLQAMSTFPEYELQIDGVAFSGFIRGGVTFEPGSAEFTPDYAQVLDVGVSVLTRDQSLQLIIEGHTDSTGPAEVNLELSQQRADAVMGYFVANGIAPSRLTAIGLGETTPVGPNDTADQQARNRRIEFKLNSNS